MFCWFSIKTAINHPPTRFILNCFFNFSLFPPHRYGCFNFGIKTWSSDAATTPSNTGDKERGS